MNRWWCEHCGAAFPLSTEMDYRGEWLDGARSPALCKGCAVILATITRMRKQLAELEAVWNLNGGSR